MIVQERPGWQQAAACAGVGAPLFFPGQGGDAISAPSYCAACPVRAECLEYALDNCERFGIWGGLSERERRRIRRVGVLR